ncbi:MAG: hypothetical protein ACKV1O_18950 [Saprospiraceae bacterium]
MPLLYYLTSDQRYLEALAPYFGAQGYDLLPYTEGIEKTKNLVLLIFSPLKCGNVRISPENIWKKYLKAENPQARLINIGFEEAVHSNYIDILNLPEQLSEFIKKAMLAHETWQPVFTGGLEMFDKLNRFFKGHGRESLTSELINVKTTTEALNNAVSIRKWTYEAAALAAFNDDYVWKNWNAFFDRWIYYYPVLNYLPFSNEIHHINEVIEEIEPFFSKQGQDVNLFFVLDCAGKVNVILRMLNDIEKTYANES